MQPILLCASGIPCRISAWVCVFCVYLHYGLCYSQLGVQVDTVTVPRRATERPCHPTTEALSPCSSWLVMDFLLSLFLSFSLPFFFSKPIFLSEVLIWSAGQWGEGTERGDQGREGQKGGGVWGGAEWWWLQTDSPLFLLSQAPLLSLRGSSCVGAFQREREREWEKLWRKKRAQWSVQLESWNITCVHTHPHTHASNMGMERNKGSKEQINWNIGKKQQNVCIRMT